MKRSNTALPGSAHSLASTVSVLAAAVGYQALPASERIQADNLAGAPVETDYLLAAYHEIDDVEARQAILDLVGAAQSFARRRAERSPVGVQRRA